MRDEGAPSSSGREVSNKLRAARHKSRRGGGLRWRRRDKRRIEIPVEKIAKVSRGYFYPRISPFSTQRFSVLYLYIAVVLIDPKEKSKQRLTRRKSLRCQLSSASRPFVTPVEFSSWGRRWRAATSGSSSLKNNFGAVRIQMSVN